MPAVGKGQKVGRRGGGEPPIGSRCEGEDEPSASRKLEPALASRDIPPDERVEASSTTVKDRKVVDVNDDDMWERFVEEAKTTKRQCGRLRRGSPGAECRGGGKGEREVRCNFLYRFDASNPWLGGRRRAIVSRTGRGMHGIPRRGSAGVDTHTHSFVGKSGRCVGLG